MGACRMSHDDHDLPPPTYRSCSNDALDDYDDTEYQDVDGQPWNSVACDGVVEADAMSATARGILDTTLDPSQVDLGALRDLIQVGYPYRPRRRRAGGGA